MAGTAWLGARYEQGFSLATVAGLGLALWVVLMTLADLGQRIKRLGSGMGSSGEGIASKDNLSKGSPVLGGLRKLSRTYWAMFVAHNGIAVCAVGIVLTSVYSQQQELAMSPGQEANVAGYTFRLAQLRNERGPNYNATLGDFVISRGRGATQQLIAEKRVYHAGKNVMTEAGIIAGLWRDLYVSLGEPLQDGSGQGINLAAGEERWAVRIYIKPFIRWIWFGALLMAFGGLLSAFDKRALHRVNAVDSSRAGTGSRTGEPA
ncbi:MAG: hypothetical protein HKO07_03295 [Pseudomonadales bacterium]|nr:hypothetical protein [Pseudomonadales bacterium]